MANTPVVVLDDTLTDIADAIRAKTGGSATMTPSEMPTEIASIPSGGSVGIPREVDANGVYRYPAQPFAFSLPAGATNLNDYVLWYAFANCSALTSVDLSPLTKIENARESLSRAFYACTNLISLDMSSLVTTINATDCCTYMCSGCNHLQSVDLSSLTTLRAGGSFTSAFSGCSALTTLKIGNLATIQSSNALQGAFNNCSSLTSVDLGKLTTLGTESSSMQSAFSGCTSLSSVNLQALSIANGNSALNNAFSNTALTTFSFQSLSEIKSNYVLRYCFQNCHSLTSVSFPALTASSFGSFTNQFNNMLLGVTGCTVHFPAAIQSTIENWSDVQNGFGGTNTTVLFDL